MLEQCTDKKGSKYVHFLAIPWPKSNFNPSLSRLSLIIRKRLQIAFSVRIYPSLGHVCFFFCCVSFCFGFSLFVLTKYAKSSTCEVVKVLNLHLHTFTVLNACQSYARITIVGLEILECSRFATYWVTMVTLSSSHWRKSINNEQQSLFLHTLKLTYPKVTYFDIILNRFFDSSKIVTL